MLQIRCADSGTYCEAVLKAYGQGELRRALAEHLRRDHSVATPSRTIMNYMAGLAEEVSEP